MAWTLIVVGAVVTAVCCWPLTVHAATVTPTASPAPKRPPLTATTLSVAGAAAALCVAAVATARLGLVPPLPVALATIAAGTALTISDLRARRLPDWLIAPILIVWMATATATVVLRMPDALTALVRALIAAAAVSVAVLSLALIRSGFGLGDVKLSGVLAAVTAWAGIEHLIMLIAAFAGLSLIAATLTWARTRNLHTTIPAGPALCAAAVIAILI